MYTGTDAPSYTTVKRLAQSYREGKQEIEDAPRPGRPIVSTTTENIDLVRSIINDDPYITYDRLEEETDLSRFTLHTIIHDHLGLRKITSRWVPHKLTIKNRQDRVRICKENLNKFESGAWRLYDVVTGDESWFYHYHVGRKQSNKSWLEKGESPRTLVRQGRFSPKTMVCLFFKTTGVVLVSYLESGKTINHETYIDYCLDPLIKELYKIRPIDGVKNIKLHHDNARPHVHQAVKSYLKDNSLHTIDHPPYSPDLAPCDFWLFDYIKQRLGSHANQESLVCQIADIVKNIDHSEYIKTFEKWLERMKLFIKNEGGYFEHI